MRAGVSRRHVFDAVEASLRRLGVEMIDLLYLHKEDHATPLGETVRALADLIRAGKIRYFGVSNYRSWRVAEICRLCDEAGIDRPIASQPLYNVLNREVEVEHLPACGYFGLGAVPYSPLARGVLTGKYAPNVVPDPASRAGRRDRRMMESEWRPESLAIAAGDRGTYARTWRCAGGIRLRLGVEQPVRHRGYGGASHGGAVGRIRRGAGTPSDARGRGTGGPAGLARPSVNAGLQRPAISDRGTGATVTDWTLIIPAMSHTNFASRSHRVTRRPSPTRFHKGKGRLCRPVAPRHSDCPPLSILCGSAPRALRVSAARPPAERRAAAASRRTARSAGSARLPRYPAPGGPARRPATVPAARRRSRRGRRSRPPAHRH